jgi:hypothetical protein
LNRVNLALVQDFKDPLTTRPSGAHLSIIPAPGRLRQEDLKFKANLVYIGRPCLKE